MTRKGQNIHNHQIRLMTKTIGLCLVLFSASSCLNEKPRSGARSAGASAGINNTPASVAPGFGRILEDNPIILSGNPNLSPDVNLSTLLTNRQEYITNRQFLEGECTQIPGICYEVKKDEVTAKIQSTSTRWAYPPTSTEFLQVNTLGHMNRMIGLFQNNLKSSFENRTFNAQGPSVIGYRTALPFTLYSNRAHWKTTPLVGFADSGVQDNAFFSPATFSMALGQDSIFPQVKFAQDPTVIYHEIGHALVAVKSNIRNKNSSLPLTSDLGYYFYDEAGAINEGIADFYSYVMNGRAHFGEWALGRFIRQSRPLSESDPLHAAGITKTREGRLAYPAFLSYDPNRPEGSFEDIHYAGQIISHYLVALTEMLKENCNMNHSDAAGAVVYMMTETIAELGDLTARGSDHNLNPNQYQVNLNDTINTQTATINSLTWLRTARPIDYRNFMQTMGRLQLEVFGNPIFARCNGTALLKDDIERLIDDYGLLLFRTYNTNKNSIPGVVNTQVSVANRIRSELVSKNAIRLDPREGRPQAFIFDDRAQMVKALESLTASGQITESISSQIESDLPFNNGNARVSPGEFLGVALNLYNDSNSPIAGVEVLANDWDHTKNQKMCNNFEDGFPLETEGAADLTAGEGAVGGCDYTTRSNGSDGDTIAPVCFIQRIDGSSTEWVSQENFRLSIPGIEAQDCLAGADQRQNCFVRFPRGSDKATFSKINPKKSFGETITGTEGVAEFNVSNILFMEVNKKTPPGTTFNCRMRVRFTNCDECWHDPLNSNDDYQDYEFAGPRPFKLINFRFTVID